MKAWREAARYDPDRERQVAAAGSALSQRHRTALILTYYQSLPNREVAQIMGISIRALESLLVRARRELKTILEESI